MPEMLVSWSTQHLPPKSPEDYDKDRVDKYANYFEENRILPIPELGEAVKPKTLSYKVIDLRTTKLAGFFKKKFNECPGNDTKQSDGEVWVMLELWRIQIW